jgi:hypothetical protein
MTRRAVAGLVTGLVAGLLLAGLPGLALSRAAAQEVAVPVAVQIPILAKILNFDRKLPERADGGLVIGVLFQSRYRTSARVADEVCETLRGLPAGAFGAVEPSCVAIDLDASSALDSVLKLRRVGVLYVSPLRAYPLASVVAVTRAGRIITLTGVPRYVETGLAIGVGMKGERPEIVINLAASRAEGADLTAHLLKLARVVGEDVAGR